MKYSNDPSIQLNTMKEYISRSKDPLVIAQREKEIVEAREDARLAEEECHKSNAALSEAQAQQVNYYKTRPYSLHNHLLSQSFQLLVYLYHYPCFVLFLL